MLNFIIPVRSRVVSKDWTRLQELLARTLKNLFAQSDSRWRAIIVCHEIPEILDIIGKSGQVRCIGIEGLVPRSRLEMMQDKRRKTEVAVRFIMESIASEDYLCIIDPDDIIHRDITKHVHENSTRGGWYIGSGYAARRHPLVLLYLENYEKVCGSSFVVSAGPWVENSDGTRRLIELLNMGHHVRRQLFHGMGIPLEKIPFAGGVYTIETGDNHSGSFIEAHGGITRLIRQLPNLRLVLRHHLSAFPALTD